MYCKRVKSTDRGDRDDDASYTEKFGNIFLAVLPITLFVLMINLVKQLFFAEEKIHSINLLKQS